MDDYEKIKKEQDRKRKWDIRFLDLCDHISLWSRDPSTKTGCVIVDNQNRVISIGYNGFPRGVPDKEEWYADRERKYYLVCHADRNALDNAPCDVLGMTMYITDHPCSECQKSIIQKGIKRVVWYKSDPAFEARWKVSNELLELAGVKWEEYERPSKIRQASRMFPDLYILNTGFTLSPQKHNVSVDEYEKRLQEVKDFHKGNED